MGFEKGSLSFRMLFVPCELTDEDVARFAAHTLPPLTSLAEDEIHGWVAGRHLLDRHITEDTAWLGGYLRLTLTQAKKKIPNSLLQAECAVEEIAVMQAEGKGYLNQNRRREIKAGVQERLLPEMPPQLKGIDMVYDPRSRILYCSATSEKQFDAFVLNFLQTIGFAPEPAVPETMAFQLEGLNAENWPPVSFSETLDDGAVDGTLGREFLMWLWYASERQGGTVQIPDLGEFAFMVEGPLTFVMEGKGAHEIVLKKGEPIFSAETRAALFSGKKLSKAKLTFARGEELWSFELDADEFVFRGMKLPQTEAFDRITKFQERMIFLDTFRQVFFHLFRQFLRLRNSSSDWEETKSAMRRWVKERPATT